MRPSPQRLTDPPDQLPCPTGSVLTVIALGQVEGTELVPATVHKIFRFAHRTLSACHVRRQALPGRRPGGARAPTALSAVRREARRDTPAVRGLPRRPARHHRASGTAATTDNALAA